MRTHTTHHHIVTVNGTDIELELPVTPSTCMGFLEPEVHIGKETILVAYLADDHHVPNPLDEDDFAGSIYEARRHGSTLGDYCRALGLRRDGGGPDLDLVYEDDVVAAAHKRLAEDTTLLEHAFQHCRRYFDDNGKDELEYVTDCLDSINELTPVMDVPALQLELWKAGRAAGTIGAKHSVMLDVYEHGGISYSVSGSGMQCRFDTARGGAVWVPSEDQIEEIEKRGPVYMKGKILVNRLRSKRQVNVRTWETFGKFDDVVHPTFEHWHDAFNYLQGLPRDGGYLQPLEDALDDAAREMARIDAEQYTHWRNGNCFAGVLAIYDLDGKLVEDEVLGGYVDDADDALAQFVADCFEPRKEES